MSNFKKYLNVYEFETTLPGCGEVVSFKPLSTGQIKKLLTYENEDDPRIVEVVLDKMISGSVITPDFNIDNLSLQDRFFILVEIRKKSKGNKYQFKWKCGACETQNFANIDLNKLKVIPFPDNIDYMVKLDDKLSLKMNYVKRGNLKEVYALYDEEAKTTDAEKMAEMAMMSHAASIEAIISPEGEESPSWEDKLFFVNEAPQLFYESIVDWTRKYNYGVDFRYKLKCKGCKNKVDQEVPLEDFFF